MDSNLKGRYIVILQDRSMDAFVGAFGIKWKGLIGLTLFGGMVCDLSNLFQVSH